MTTPVQPPGGVPTGGSGTSKPLVSDETRAAAVILANHASGCTQRIGPMSRRTLIVAMVVLTECHPHVFIVDQSDGPDEAYLSCSKGGVDCLREARVL